MAYEDILIKIIKRLETIFDKVEFIENDIGLKITVTNKGKQKIFHYAKGTYEAPWSVYEDNAVRIQCAGMIQDCVDEFNK